MTLNAIPFNDYGNVGNSCTICIVLLVIFLIISISIGTVFIYFRWSLKEIVLNAIPLKQQFIEYINDNFQKN